MTKNTNVKYQRACIKMQLISAIEEHIQLLAEREMSRPTVAPDIEPELVEDAKTNAKVLAVQGTKLSRNNGFVDMIGCDMPDTEAVFDDGFFRVFNKSSGAMLFQMRYSINPLKGIALECGEFIEDSYEAYSFGEFSKAVSDVCAFIDDTFDLTHPNPMMSGKRLVKS